MRAKAMLAVMLAILIAVAALPQVLAYDLTEDPGIRVWEKYEKAGILTPDNKSYDLYRLLAEKYNKGGLKALTADEAYVLLRYYGLIAQKGWVDEISVEEWKEKWLELAETYPDYPPAWKGLISAAEDAGDVAMMFYAYTRYLERVPSGKIVGAPRSNGKAWRNFADKLEEYGYAKAAEFPRRAYEEKLYEKLGSKVDLYQIGFYDWREQYVMPMYEQRGTLKGDLQAKLARLNALTGGKFFIAPLLLLVTILVLGYAFLKLLFAGGKKTLVSLVFLVALLAVVYYFDLYLAHTVLFAVANPLAALAIGAVAFIAAAALVVKKVRSKSAA